ncbi:response regulator [Chitinophaga arvensicola]|uniref:Response regulator receiver domain-containing protein n=1 Tax=Chitinophaga arvensicola TaxID=29529 RepID=A0A1I0RS42_9BACT|nr:response regulator [Chitinophaga arvensicola]SEW44035.1 Response regulator receiver domain-containing protein [Chitinophaga arvensicola]
MKKKITSLLIDAKPDQRIQFYLSLDLLQVNRACVCQDNTFDALAYLKQHSDFIPDYIFISADLPVEHATAFMKHVRKISRLADIPVLHFAAPGEALALAPLTAAGFNGCLLKQRDIYTLRDALRMIFEQTFTVEKAPAPVSPLSNVAVLIKEMLQRHQVLLEAPHRLSA